jgi:large subunit ribosomal protein L9
MEIQIISRKNHQTQQVKRGHFRYLLAQKAVFPTNKEHQFAPRREELAKAEAEQLQNAQALAKQLQSLELKLTSRVADTNRLYGSLGAKELAAAITNQGIAVDKRSISLSSGPIRQLGEHRVTVNLHPQVQITLSVQVEAKPT